MFCDDKIVRSTMNDDAPQASLLLVESKIGKVIGMVVVDNVAWPDGVKDYLAVVDIMFRPAATNRRSSRCRQLIG